MLQYPRYYCADQDMSFVRSPLNATTHVGRRKERSFKPRHCQSNRKFLSSSGVGWNCTYFRRGCARRREAEARRSPCRRDERPKRGPHRGAFRAVSRIPSGESAQARSRRVRQGEPPGRSRPRRIARLNAIPTATKRLNFRLPFLSFVYFGKRPIFMTLLLTRFIAFSIQYTGDRTMPK